jgi:hypothetical protein
VRKLSLYSRPGCHLCEELESELLPLLAGRAVVEIVDISDDPELERRYWLRIPVLVDGDEELSEYPLDRDRVRRHLAGT